MAEESLGIPKENLDDFSFRDSNHHCLCCAIAVGKVVSQLQMHFLVTGVILQHTQAQGWDDEHSRFAQGLHTRQIIHP